MVMGSEAIAPQDGDALKVVAFPRQRQCVREEPCAPNISAEALQTLGTLRDYLAKSRLSGVSDVDGAYRRLVAAKGRGAEAYGVTLFHALGVASHRQIVFNCRICPRASADETWLLRLLEAQTRGDSVNVRALLGFLIQKPWRRRFGALIAGLAEHLERERARRKA